MSRAFVAVSIVLAAGSLGAGIAVADPDLPNIPPHRHYVQTDNGRVEVGPRVCDDARLQKAFNQFHSNIHVAVSGSPGPEHSAPGLHNFRGGDLTASGC